MKSKIKILFIFFLQNQNNSIALEKNFSNQMLTYNSGLLTNDGDKFLEACQKAKIKKALFYLDNGVKLNTINGLGENALKIIFKSVDALMCNPICIPTFGEINGFYYLFNALLFKYNIDPNACDFSGQTVIQCLVKSILNFRYEIPVACMLEKFVIDLILASANTIFDGNDIVLSCAQTLFMSHFSLDFSNFADFFEKHLIQIPEFASISNQLKDDLKKIQYVDFYGYEKAWRLIKNFYFTIEQDIKLKKILRTGKFWKKFMGYKKDFLKLFNFFEKLKFAYKFRKNKIYEILNQCYNQNTPLEINKLISDYVI